MGVYGVTVGDIAAEIPQLFKTGFSSATSPTADTVAQWIENADTFVALRVQDIVGTAPAITDRAATLAKDYVINAVLARVMRAVYAGRVAPDQLNASSAGYFGAATAMLDELTKLGAQAEGTGESSPSLAVGPIGLPTRDLIVSDADLDRCQPHRERRY